MDPSLSLDPLLTHSNINGRDGVSNHQPPQPFIQAQIKESGLHS